jgi:ATP-dependent Clp protease ATP-binding subunit ClpC
MSKETFHQKLTFHARHSLKEASHLASFTKFKEVQIEHLLLSLFLEKGSLGSILLRSMGFEAESLSSACLKKGPGGQASTTAPSLSENLKDIVRRAYALANEFQYPYVGTEHLVYALMEAPSDNLDDLLLSLDIDDKKIESSLASHMNFDHLPSLGRILELPENTFPKKDSSETPFLDQFATDLTASHSTSIFIGRETEIDRLIQILSRKNKNNPLILGEPGVGKTALVAALAERIEQNNVPHYLQGKRVLALDLALVVAGTNFRGEFENRLKEIIRETTENKNIILFIDELHTLVGAGNTQGGLDAANILKPVLARGEIRCIGATTFSEYKRHIEKDAALERRFQTIHLAEPELLEAKQILQGVAVSYEVFHGVAIAPALLDRAAELSVRFMSERFLPDKALDIIDEAAALARHSLPVSKDILTKGQMERALRTLEQEKLEALKDEYYDQAASLRDQALSLKEKLGVLESKLQKRTPEELPSLEKIHIDRTVSRMTAIPYDVIAADTPMARIKKLARAFRQTLVGQKHISETVIEHLTHATLGLRKNKKPLASFLFLGPTGVGKTFTAKLLAEHFFGTDKALIRFDMSEFGERHTVAQMLGAPAGYVGYGEGGKLTEAVRRKPYSVILFDEIDKAHPDVFNILLQILDEGHVTDAEGKLVDFSQTVIILTSNQGAQKLLKESRIGFKSNSKNSSTGAAHKELEATLRKELKKTWRPELLARLGETLVFLPLAAKDIEQILRKEIKLLTEHFQEKGYTISVAPEVIKFVTEQSLSLADGARLVHKNVQSLLEKPLLTQMLKKSDHPYLTLTLKNKKIVCTTSQKPSKK